MCRPPGARMRAPAGPIMIGPGPRIGALVRQLRWLARLPPRVAAFYLRCVLVALRTRDRWSLGVVTRPRELSGLIEAARGSAVVVEDGTASAWTAAALVLAEPGRTVITLDPFPRPERERYLRLLDPEARSRIALVQARTEAGPAALADTAEPPAVQFLFLDGDHSRDGVIAALRAWRGALVPGAVVALHDYGDPAYPGVAEAIGELGLDGAAQGRLFVART